jgi:hypothetical protein
MPPGMTVSSLMGDQPAPDPQGSGMAEPAEGETPKQDDTEQQTMSALVEEFRSAPINDASEALEQLVKLIVRKHSKPAA